MQTTQFAWIVKSRFLWKLQKISSVLSADFALRMVKLKVLLTTTADNILIFLFFFQRQKGLSLYVNHLLVTSHLIRIYMVCKDVCFGLCSGRKGLDRWSHLIMTSHCVIPQGYNCSCKFPCSLLSWFVPLFSFQLPVQYLIFVFRHLNILPIMKTCLFKYIENFTTKNGKFSDKILTFFIFPLKT